jgi:hypothetical protein
MTSYCNCFCHITISSAAGTASDGTDTKHKTFHHSEICPEESAVPVSCSFWLAE